MISGTLFVDYGEVISTAQPTASISRMAELDKDGFTSRYWAPRNAYDAGCPAAEDWVHVMGRDPAPPDLLRALARRTCTDREIPG